MPRPRRTDRPRNHPSTRTRSEDPFPETGFRLFPPSFFLTIRPGGDQAEFWLPSPPLFGFSGENAQLLVIPDRHRRFRLNRKLREFTDFTR